MFWVHGGGWQTGSAALYTPEYILDHDIVLVTVNYRLGVLGNFCCSLIYYLSVFPQVLFEHLLFDQASSVLEIFILLEILD